MRGDANYLHSRGDGRVGTDSERLEVTGGTDSRPRIGRGSAITHRTPADRRWQSDCPESSSRSDERSQERHREASSDILRHFRRCGRSDPQKGELCRFGIGARDVLIGTGDKKRRIRSCHSAARSAELEPLPCGAPVGARNHGRRRSSTCDEQRQETEVGSARACG